MLGLIYKDLLTHRTQITAISIVMLFFLCWLIIAPVSSPDLNDLEIGLVIMLCSICTMLSLGMFESGIFHNDELRKWQAYISSAPDGIKKQIGSKYLFNALMSCTVTLILTIFSGASASIIDKDITVFNMAVMQFLWIQLLIRSIETPFIIRFGSRYGDTIRMILVAVVTFSAIVYGLFGDISIFGSLADFFKWMGDFLKNDSAYVLRLIPVVTWILYYLSYRISCAVYLKGGDNYDK